MNKLILPILLLLFLQLSCKDNGTDPPPKINPPGWQEDIPWQSLDANPWPIHHGDAQFTGRSKYSGPQLGQVEWMIELPTTNLSNDSFLSPIIGADSTIYFVSYKDTASPGSFLYALRFDGSIKWTFPLPSPTQKNSSPPVLASDGTIYVATWGNKLYAINADGTLKWELDILPLGIKSMMNLDREGNLYAFASDGVLYKITSNGITVWNVTLDDFGSSSSAVVFSPDGKTMYITGRKMFAVSTDGVLLWSYDPSPNTETWSSTPLVNFQGIIYLDYGLSRLTSTGELYPIYEWSDSVVLMPTDIDPTIDKHGNVTIGTRYEILSVDYLGSLRWRKLYDLKSFFSLICDDDGMTYFLTLDNKLTKIDRLGNEIWQLHLDGQYLYSPALSNQRIYLGTVRGTKKYFYSIK